MTFSVFLDIFYPPNFGCFEKYGLFQHPLAITLIDPRVRVLNECNGLFSTVSVEHNGVERGRRGVLLR